MQHDHDGTSTLLEQINHALNHRIPLRIQGSNSKAFLGRPVAGEALDTRCHSGIVSYDPTELVISARAGTRLTEIEEVLEAAGQMLPCEPPHLGHSATLGGAVAAGLSGPRRPWAGSIRDYVLGTRVITGRGKHLRFGGEVMKNVAGYDLSRLMAGSFGCLGVLTEISLKVLPKPRACLSLRVEMDIHQALSKLAQWGQQPIPISAACYDGQALYLRLEGGEGSVQASRQLLGGEEIDSGYWQELREQRHAFFDNSSPLWRLSLPNNIAPLDLPGAQLIDWGGAQRWLKTGAERELIHRVVTEVGGHATSYSQEPNPFPSLTPPLLRYHKRLKNQLDPLGIFNPGRMYAEV